MVFLSYRHPRLLRWQGAVSETAVTARGIVAGCGAAMAILRAVIIPTLDEFSVHFTSMGLKVYADDIACRYEAPELETLLFPRMAAAQSGLGVSWDKFLVVASHVKLAKRFAQFWAEWCEGRCRGGVIGRRPECGETRLQSQAKGQAQIVDLSCKKGQALA